MSEKEMNEGRELQETLAVYKDVLDHYGHLNESQGALSPKQEEGEK